MSLSLTDLRLISGSGRLMDERFKRGCGCGCLFSLILVLVALFMVGIIILAEHVPDTSPADVVSLRDPPSERHTGGATGARC